MDPGQRLVLEVTYDSLYRPCRAIDTAAPCFLTWRCPWEKVTEIYRLPGKVTEIYRLPGDEPLENKHRP